MKDLDLTPYERAARNLGEADGWELAEAEGRLEAVDILGRLTNMALFEFGENRGEWPVAFDEEGFLTALTAEGARFDGGLSIHVWPDDHPPPHVHILKKSEPDGREERTGDRCGLGRECERLGYFGFELDGSQAAEGVLGSLAVILPLDPDDDGQSELLPRRPPLLVEHVRLQQRPERL